MYWGQDAQRLKGPTLMRIGHSFSEVMSAFSPLLVLVAVGMRVSGPSLNSRWLLPWAVAADYFDP